jgi:hypothetical protein
MAAPSILSERGAGSQVGRSGVQQSSHRICPRGSCFFLVKAGGESCLIIACWGNAWKFHDLQFDLERAWGSAILDLDGVGESKGFARQERNPLNGIA